MKMNNVPMVAVESNVGMKRKGGSVGGLDTQQYGRGKRAREVCSVFFILTFNFITFPYYLKLAKLQLLRFDLMKSN